jgi:hypothetical protein
MAPPRERGYQIVDFRGKQNDRQGQQIGCGGSAGSVDHSNADPRAVDPGTGAVKACTAIVEFTPRLGGDYRALFTAHHRFCLARGRRRIQLTPPSVPGRSAVAAE